jgi:hypothetical protein
MVGTRRFKFDVFSNDVNLANEMESTGTAGRVHISEATARFLDDEYLLEDGQQYKGWWQFALCGAGTDRGRRVGWEIVEPTIRVCVGRLAGRNSRWRLQLGRRRGRQTKRAVRAYRLSAVARLKIAGGRLFQAATAEGTDGASPRGPPRVVSRIAVSKHAPSARHLLLGVPLRDRATGGRRVAATKVADCAAGDRSRAVRCASSTAGRNTYRLGGTNELTPHGIAVVCRRRRGILATFMAVH